MITKLLCPKKTGASQMPIKAVAAPWKNCKKASFLRCFTASGVKLLSGDGVKNPCTLSFTF
jgi:hypothetical protein